MLRPIHFNDQFGRCAVKVYDKSADDPLLVNLHRVFTEKKIPELALMGCHFLAKPPGIFQLAVIFWYDHFSLSVLASLGHLSQRERQVARPTYYTARCIEVCPLSVNELYFVCYKQYSE